MKTYLDELIEKLTAMRDSGEEIRVEEVLRTVYLTIMEGKLPANFRREMLGNLMAMDGFTADEAGVMKALDEKGIFKE